MAIRAPRSEAPAWLGSAAAAMMLTFDVDAEAPLLADDPGHGANAMLMAHQSFGPLVGVPRILELLAEQEVRATFFVPGVTAERHPSALESILAADHEVGHHSHSHPRYVDLEAAEEEEDFERGLEVLRRFGVDVRGHRTPLSSASPRTAGLVARHGLSYESTLMDDDRPYRLMTGEGSIIELPPYWGLDDWLQYVNLPVSESFRVKPVADVIAGWQLELEALRREGGLCVLTMHPFAHGRGSRMRGLRALIADARAAGDVVFLTGAEAARRAEADPALAVRELARLLPDPDPAVYPAW